MAILIREANDCDAAVMADIHIASWREAYQKIIPNDILENLDVGQRTQQWIANITADALHTIVAEVDGQIVGFASFADTRDEDNDPATVAEIQAIYVKPVAWGKGVGRTLCQSVIEDLSTQSYDHVTLWVLKNNQHARRFYELAGFTRDGKIKTETIGIPLQVVRYRKSLQFIN